MKAHVLCKITLFFPENRAVYEIIWKKYATVRQTIEDNIMWRIIDAICMADI